MRALRAAASTPSGHRPWDSIPSSLSLNGCKDRKGGRGGKAACWEGSASPGLQRLPRVGWWGQWTRGSPGQRLPPSCSARTQGQTHTHLRSSGHTFILISKPNHLLGISTGRPGSPGHTGCPRSSLLLNLWPVADRFQLPGPGHPFIRCSLQGPPCLIPPPTGLTGSLELLTSPSPIRGAPSSPPLSFGAHYTPSRDHPRSRVGSHPTTPFHGSTFALDESRLLVPPSPSSTHPTPRFPAAPSGSSPLCSLHHPPPRREPWVFRNT